MSRIIPSKPSLTISEREMAQNNTTKGKLLYTKYQNKLGAFLITKDRLQAVSFQSQSKLGNIYICKVKNIVKNIDACFVEIADKEICFLPLKEAVNPFVLNRTFDGRIKEGDEFPVQITRDAQKTKQASVTANFSEEWKLTFGNIAHRTCYSTIYRNQKNELPQLDNCIYPDEYDEMVTDEPNVYNLLLQSGYSNVRMYQDSFISLNKLYSIDSKMEMALERRIWLKSGANLIIEPTEALTVIDVNSGKYEGRRDSDDDTALKVNLEAAKEVAHQLRLRNLSGIIVIDFINMRKIENKQTLLQALSDAVSLERTYVKVIDMTPLGLVELTRKKISKPLKEQLLNK